MMVKYTEMRKRRKPAPCFLAFFGFQATKDVAGSLLRRASEDDFLIAVDRSVTNFTTF